MPAVCVQSRRWGSTINTLCIFFPHPLWHQLKQQIVKEKFTVSDETKALLCDPALPSAFWFQAFLLTRLPELCPLSGFSGRKSFVVEDLSKNLVVFLHSLHRCCGTEGEHISLLVVHLSLMSKFYSFSVFITYFILYGANINCIESAAWLVIGGLQSQAAKVLFV